MQLLLLLLLLLLSKLQYYVKGVDALYIVEELASRSHRLAYCAFGKKSRQSRSRLLCII